MELFKRNFVLLEGAGGGAGGNSIDIEASQVSSVAAQIHDGANELTQAFNAASSAVDAALACFDAGDSNKPTLQRVLTNGTKDISSAVATKYSPKDFNLSTSTYEIPAAI